MAGLHCEFSNSRKGLSIHVSGYNDKASVLLKRVVEAANQICKADTCDKTELTHELFERIQEKLEKQWLAFLVAQPYQHAMYAADLCLEQPKWHFKSQMECIKELNRGDLIRFSKQVFARMHLEVLVHGNVTAQEAKDMGQILLDGWKPSRALTLPEIRVVQLPQQKQFAETVYRMLGWNEPDSNSVVANIYQIGEMGTRENATLSVLGQLVREPAFNQLRTEEQMGYIVFSQVKTIGDNIKGLLLLVQGDTYDPIHMDERIEIFLDNFRDTVVAMSDEDFTDNIAAVCQTLLEKKKNLIEESSGYWNVISNQTYRFRRLQEIAEQAQNITKTDVLCLFDRYVLRTSPHRRRLSVQVFGCNHRDRINVNKEMDDTNGKKILWVDDPVEFARVQPLFPVQAIASLGDGLKMDA
jgi:insulysin